MSRNMGVLVVTCVLVSSLGLVTNSLAAEALLQIDGDWQAIDSGRSLEQQIRLVNDVTSYGLTYDIFTNQNTPPDKCSSRLWAHTIGYVTLGMTSPVYANWYGQGFLAVKVDDVSLHDRPAEFRTVRGAGPDVLVEGTWQTPKGPVFLRLALRGGDDKLLMQVALGPDTKAERLEVRLLGYPQAFEQPRSRRMATATGDVATGAKLDFKTAEQPWALFYDERADRESTGGGPCGVTCVPDELESGNVSLGSYSVHVTLLAKAGGRTVTAGLWDFTANREVATVREHLRGAGGMIAEDLAAVAKVDWLAAPLPPVQLPDDYVELLAKRIAERRRPTPYDEMTADVVTPHIPLAKPLAGGPVRVLVIAPRWYQRETVELAQRLDMEYDTVCVSSADQLLDPRSLYLYGSYDVYGYPRKNEMDVLYDLSTKLRADHDCIILSGIRPQTIPKHLRRVIVDKVRDGAGILLFGDSRPLLGEFDDELEKTSRSSPLQKISVEVPPAAESAHQYGQGRVLEFGYNTGNRGTRLALTPGRTHEDPDVLRDYDYWLSVVASGVLWAAGRAVPVRLASGQGMISANADEKLENVTLEFLVDDPQRRLRFRRHWKIDLPKGETLFAPSLSAPPDLRDGSSLTEDDRDDLEIRFFDAFNRGQLQEIPGWNEVNGRYLTTFIKRDGKVLAWHTVDLGERQRRSISAIELRENVLRPGNTVAGNVQLESTGKRLEIELWDALGRLIAQREVTSNASTEPFEFPAFQPLTVLHEVRARLLDSDRLLDQHVATFTVIDREIDDFKFLVWSSGDNHAVRHHINRVLAEGGVDWIDNTGLTGGDAQKAEFYCKNAARYGLQSVPYITRICSMQESGRIRTPCLHDPRHQRAWLRGLTDRAAGALPYAPPAYTLGDENFLVNRKLDVCTSLPSLTAFRVWLADNYESTARFNEIWKLEGSNPYVAIPATFDEIKDTPDHWPRWADHRRFMDTVLTDAHALGREAIRRADPEARVGFDGVFSLDSWHGYDFYQLCRTCDLVQVYAQRHIQVEYLRSWKLSNAVFGAWYNSIGNRDEVSAKRLGWDLLFHGCNSAWYWTSYNTGPALLFPDLRPTPQFRWMQDSIGEIKSGIGKLLLHAERQHDGIAIHYSQASVHAGTLTDRRHAAAQWGFARLVEDLGLQYDMLSYEQIEQGELNRYRVLLMPACTAIGGSEAAAIKQFVQNGGLVVADTVPGILDDHCRLLEQGQLDDLFGVKRSGLPDRGKGKVIRVRAEGHQLELPLEAFDAKLEPAGGKPWATDGKVPAVLVRQVGKGSAVMLNTAIEEYENLRKSGNGRAPARLMDKLLALAKARPQVRVVVDEENIDACETVRFVDGEIQYVCIVRDNHVAGTQPQEATVHFPLQAEVYDVREKRLMGRTDSVRTTLVPGDAKIYALLPYAVRDLSIAPVSSEAVAGEIARFRATLSVTGHEPAGPHCLRVEVSDPKRGPRRHYAQNVLTEQMTTEIAVPLALNDPPGKWQLRVTDVASGRSAIKEFIVFWRVVTRIASPDD